MAMSFPFARTVICACSRASQSPSNLSSPVSFGLGFTVLMMIGTAVSTMIGTGCRRGLRSKPANKKRPPPVSISGNPNPAILTILFIHRHPWQFAVTLKIARPGRVMASRGAGLFVILFQNDS